MQKRSIEWLRGKVYRRVRLCQERDHAHVDDPNFEHWIMTDGVKQGSIWCGEKFEADGEGFTFYAMAAPLTNPTNPFRFVKPVFTCYRCDWSDVIGAYEGSEGGLFVFTKPAMA